MADILDRICVVYLDDILIYSDNEREHTRYVQEVLKRLRQYGLYAKLSKCEFAVKRVSFLGFILSPDGVEIERS